MAYTDSYGTTFGERRDSFLNKVFRRSAEGNDLSKRQRKKRLTRSNRPFLATA
jgi:hypothetical protein